MKSFWSQQPHFFLTGSRHRQETVPWASAPVYPPMWEGIIPPFLVRLGNALVLFLSVIQMNPVSPQQQKGSYPLWLMRVQTKLLGHNKLGYEEMVWLLLLTFEDVASNSPTPLPDETYCRCHFRYDYLSHRCVTTVVYHKV